MLIALQTCAANDPGSEQWLKGSFVGRLTEDGVFDPVLYEALEKSILAAGRDRPAVQTVWTLLRILERITLLVGCHLDPADVYRIANMQDEQVADFNNHFRFMLRDVSLQQTRE